MDISPHSENLLPDASWDLERLAVYTQDRFELAVFFGRKTALQLWRAGQAIQFVKRKLTAERKWTVWAQEHGLPLTAVYEAVRIAERFETEDDILGLTTLEVKQIAGTVKARAKTKGAGPSTKPENDITTVKPRDEKPVADGGSPVSETATDIGNGSTPDSEISGDSGGGGKLDPKTESGSGDDSTPEPAPPEETSTPETTATQHDWSKRLEELRAEVAAIEETVILVQEWANRESHPMSSALLRVLIEAGQILVEFDEEQEVVRVDDHDLIVALAAAETLFDPIFAALGITPEIAARHLTEMVQEGKAGTL